MRKTFFLIVLALFVTGVTAQDNAATLISNFEAEGITNWWTYSDELGSTFTAQIDNEVVYDGESALRMDINILSGGFAGAGFDYGTPFDWTAGEGIRLKLRASKPGIVINFVLHMADETQTSEASPGSTPFAYVFTTPEGSQDDWMTVDLGWDGFQRLWWVGEAGISEFNASAVRSFEIAYEGLKDAPNEGTVWFDDIRVISTVDLNLPPSYAELRGEVQAVKVNNLGYRPADAKTLVTDAPFEKFHIVDTNTSDAVFTGESSSWGFDNDSQAEVFTGNFDAFQTPGTYKVVIDGVGESFPFDIADAPYQEAIMLAARAIYLQRSGIAIDDADKSGLTLEAGHLEPALLWDDRTVPAMDVSGGWYDAGDYGRYIATASFAVNQLMLGYEANPDAFPDGFLDIPESGNGTSDLLDEVRWELDWMLKMQREDGAVYHKVTTRSFPDYGTLAADDDSQLFVFSVSTPDTAYFAAVMAQAGRIYAEADPDFAARCLDAARSAWDWLAQNPEQFPAGGFQNPPISEYPMQGGYDFVGQEPMTRMWAAAELFRTTGEAQFEDAFAGYFDGFDGGLSMSWANAYPLALYAYLKSESTNSELAGLVAEKFHGQAAEIYAVTQQSPYGVALNDGVTGFEYQWGSNQLAMARGLLMLMSDELVPNADYAAAGQAQFNYIFGFNPLARSYFGGLGENPILHPHHNVSYHFKLSVPGFVGEGPNSQGAGGDAVLIALWDAGAPAAERYTDSWDSWASNEPTLDTNATFVALGAYVTK